MKLNLDISSNCIINVDVIFHICILSITDIPPKNIPKNIVCEVLQNVIVLLVNVNISSTYGCMEPLDGHENIYLFNQRGQQTEPITYYIGKYGACTAAIRKIPPVFQTNDTVSTVVMMADQCFPNLVAVISVGVASGIKKKVQICDVLVSSKVLNYDYDITAKKYLPKGEATAVSSQVPRVFVSSNKVYSAPDRHCNGDPQYVSGPGRHSANSPRGSNAPRMRKMSDEHSGKFRRGTRRMLVWNGSRLPRTFRQRRTTEERCEAPATP